MLFNCILAYEESDLDRLTEKLEFNEKLSETDLKNIDKLWQKYVSGARLTISEDHTVYRYEKWMNRDAKFIPSPANSNWLAFIRFGVRGWQFVVEQKVKNGTIYELEDLPNRLNQPFFQWGTKTLKIAWETGYSNRTNINFYDISRDQSKSLIASPYKDFAPHFAPLEQFILFLSNRDRKSRNDTSYAIYAVNLENVSEILKLTKQMPFATPTGGDPIIHFNNNSSFDIQLVSGEKVKFELNDLVSVARKKVIETNNKRLAMMSQKKNNKELKVKQKSFELMLDEFKFKDSSIKLVKELDRVLLKDVSPNSKDSKILMSTGFDQFKDIPGLPILPSKDKLFFIKFNDKKFKEIWQYEGYGRKPTRVSPRDENCYGMQIDENSNTIVFILQRTDSFYLVALDSQTTDNLGQYKISKPTLAHGEDLTKILNRNQYFFKDSAGNWKTPYISDTNHKSNNQSKQNLVISFLSPHLPKMDPYITRNAIKSNSEIQNIGQRSTPSISDQIESLRKSIQWISTNEELEIVMSMYNQVHERTIQKIASFKDSDSFSKRRLKIRWIESLNGIRSLLDNTKLLLEVE